LVEGKYTKRMNIPAKDWYKDTDLAINYRKDLLEQAF